MDFWIERSYFKAFSVFSSEGVYDLLALPFFTRITMLKTTHNINYFYAFKNFINSNQNQQYKETETVLKSSQPVTIHAQF